MVQIDAIFLDDGGVLNDNEVRGIQWPELVAEYFAPRYGGSRDAWIQANKVAFGTWLKHWEEAKENPEEDFFSFLRAEMELWLTTMFKDVGVAPPPIDERFGVAKKSEEWIAPRLRTAFPRAIETVRHLKKRGYFLYTASGGTTWLLKGFLIGMGILDCFEELYGADLINTMKAGPLFYRRIFEHAKITPEQALVVESHQEHALYAKEAGAIVVWVTPSNTETQLNDIYSIRRFDQLPSLLQRILTITRKL